MSTTLHCNGQDCDHETSRNNAAEWATVTVEVGGQTFESHFCGNCWIAYLVKRTAIIHEIGEQK